MINFYKRLTKNCETVNQLNRVHIALENWLTPSKWVDLRKEFLINFRSERHLSSNQNFDQEKILIEHIKIWFNKIDTLFNKSTLTEIQSYKRINLHQSIRLYSQKNIPTNEKVLIVCFSGLAQRMMMPLPIFLQHIDSQKADIALIKYPKNKSYRNGIEGISENFLESITVLKSILPTNNYQRIALIGVSGGGIPAIISGLSWHASRTIVFSGGHPRDPRWTNALNCGVDDIIKKYPKNTSGSTTLIYGYDHQLDKEAANSFKNIIPCKLIEVKEKNKSVGHLSILPILNAGKLYPFLSGLIFSDGIPSNKIPSLNALPKKIELTGPKYFCVGFNKTGTTTLGRCFEILNLMPIAEPRSKSFQFISTFKKLIDTNDYSNLIEQAKYYKSFQDRPWNVWDAYKYLDQHFPNSYFVLTERDPESWWNSVNKWLTITHKNNSEKLNRYLSHLQVKELNKDKFIDAYKTYNTNIKDYFKDKDNLLIMNLEAGDEWKKLCDFLKLPIPNKQFPHANKNISS